MRSVGHALGAAVLALVVALWALTPRAADVVSPPRAVSLGDLLLGDDQVVAIAHEDEALVEIWVPADEDATDTVAGWRDVALEAIVRAEIAEGERDACESARVAHALEHHPDGVVTDGVLGWDDGGPAPDGRALAGVRRGR